MILIPGVSKEQIARAKEWDLLTYLQTYEPHELKQCGSHEYCTRTHDSLKISNGKWCWNSQGVGGRTALDYLVKVRGMDFVGAVETLCGHRAPPPQQRAQPKPRKPFALPEASQFPSKMLSYLQDRGIHPDVLQACIQAGTLYESRRYQNCVFVGKDTEGRARFACLAGSSSIIIIFCILRLPSYCFPYISTDELSLSRRCSVRVVQQL